MPDSDEQIKHRMLQQRQAEIVRQQALQQAAVQQAIAAQLKAAMLQILEPKARERLANLRMVKPELAMQLELYLAQLYQSGQLRGKITDEQVVQVLRKLQEKPEWKIRRK
ncbi:MAG: DNA-binding protein [Candidatus Aenigmatarchaeota archaeon]